jgi:hypothetical protein
MIRDYEVIAPVIYHDEIVPGALVFMKMDQRVRSKLGAKLELRNEI